MYYNTRMKIFYSTNFTGHWPVPVSAIVVSADEQTARELLDSKLRDLNLKFDGTLIELQTDKEAAFVLNDGDY